LLPRRRETRTGTSNGEDRALVSQVIHNPGPLAALEVRESGGKLLLGVRVIPGARAARLLGVYGNRLKVAVTAAPEDGKANEQLLVILSERLRLSVKGLRIQYGHRSRDKVVAFAGLAEADLRRKLIETLAEAGLEEEGA